MGSELDQFEARHGLGGKPRRPRRPQEDDALRNAALTGIGTTTALAGVHSVRHGLQDMAENARVPKTVGYKDFLGKLEPGDLTFTREFGKEDTNKAHVYDLISGAKGDVHLHPQVYRGRGRTSEAGGGNVPVKTSRLDGGDYPLEIKAYRMKNLPEADKAKALGFLDKAAAAKTPYKSEGDTVLHALGHLAGVQPKTAASMKNLANGVVCSELVAEAFPSKFPDKFMSPIDMRHHPDMELIARYGHSVPIPIKEQMLARGVYPVLKHLKWGLGAGALAYAGTSLADHFRRKPDAQ